MPIPTSNLRLGRAEHDPVAVASAPAHQFGVSLPPPVVDRSAIAYNVEMFGNDHYSDCTCVAYANYARGVAALNGFGLGVTQDHVLAEFSRVGQTTDLASIPGLVALDVLKSQQQHGYQIDNQALVGIYGVVEINRTALSHAIARLGGAYLGVRLYERDMDTFGSTWTTDSDPGTLVGRHMINAWDYDTSGVRIGTWAQLQPATWDWLLSRLDEAYAIVWRQIARADASFYSGVNADGLIAELAN